MDIQTPRILAPHLDSFKSKFVRLSGTITQVRGDKAVLDAGGNVDLILSRDAHIYPNENVEIIGKVDPSSLAVKISTALDLGPNFDFNAAHALVEATHRYSHLFYDRVD